MRQNKLKRINLKSGLHNLPKFKFIYVCVGSLIRVSSFSKGWYCYPFFGVCTRTYIDKNGHCKINLYNRRQRLHLNLNLNLNIYKSIHRFF